MLSLFIYEAKNPNSISNNAGTHKLALGELIYFYIILYTIISLQCYYSLHYVISVYYQVDTDNIVLSNALFLIGLIMCIAGSCLRTKAKQQLGEFFTYQLGVSDGQKLITNGVYSYVMHPSYLGVCMLYLGISIAEQSIMFFTLFIAITSVTITVRIPKEEAMLAKHFEAEYEGYSKNRWRMLPFVY